MVSRFKVMLELSKWRPCLAQLNQLSANILLCSRICSAKQHDSATSNLHIDSNKRITIRYCAFSKSLPSRAAASQQAAPGHAANFRFVVSRTQFWSLSHFYVTTRLSLLVVAWRQKNQESRFDVPSPFSDERNARAFLRPNRKQ